MFCYDPRRISQLTYSFKSPWKSLPNSFKTLLGKWNSVLLFGYTTVLAARISIITIIIPSECCAQSRRDSNEHLTEGGIRCDGSFMQHETTVFLPLSLYIHTNSIIYIFIYISISIYTYKDVCVCMYAHHVSIDTLGRNKPQQQQQLMIRKGKNHVNFPPVITVFTYYNIYDIWRA